MFPHAHQLPPEYPHVLGRLRGLGGVALTTFRGVDDELFRLGFEGSEVREVAIEFAGVLPDEGVAFAHLTGKRGSLEGYSGNTCAAGSGLKKMAFKDSIS